MQSKAVFAVKVAGFVTIMLIFIFCVVMPQFSTKYTASLIDKFDRLQSINEPKIILVGDSNVAFGFDSEKIQHAFDMPVVNFGYSVDMGQAFNTEMIKSHIHEGDIVVIIPISYSDESTKISDPVLAWVAIENNYQLWSGIASENYHDMVLAFPTYLRRALYYVLENKGNKPVSGPYSRDSFNMYGDNVFPRPKGDEFEWPHGYGHLFDDNQLSQAMRIYWNEYNEYVKSRNAHLFIGCPPKLIYALETDLAPLQHQLEEDLNFPVISQLEDYVYPFEYFFDQNFHLNEHGVEVRTEQFIRDLKNALDSLYK